MNQNILAAIAAGPNTPYVQQYMQAKNFKDQRELGKLQRNRMTQEIDAYKQAQADKADAKHAFDIMSGALSSGSPQQARAVLQQYVLNDPNVDEEDKATLTELAKLPDNHLIEGLTSMREVAAKHAGIDMPKIKTPEDFTLGPGQQRFHGGGGEPFAKVPPNPTKEGAGRDASGFNTSDYGRIYNQIGKTVAGAGFGSGNWDPVNLQFVLKDPVQAQKATAVVEKAWELWQTKYNKDPAKAPEAAYEALRMFNTPIPAVPGSTTNGAAGGTGQMSFKDFLKKDHPDR